MSHHITGKFSPSIRLLRFDRSLAQRLLDQGYKVYGTSRDAQMAPFGNLVRLGLRDRVEVRYCALNDFRSVLQTLVTIKPDEVYNLAGQNSVGLSFEQPVRNPGQHQRRQSKSP